MSVASTKMDAKLVYKATNAADSKIASDRDTGNESEQVLERANLAKVKPTPKPGIFSTIFFTWLNSIVNLGYHRNNEGKGLEPEDLWELRPEFQSQNVKNSFEFYWQQEQSREKPSITRALWRLTNSLIITSAMFEFMRIIASFANPLILQVFIQEIISFCPVALTLARQPANRPFHSKLPHGAGFDRLRPGCHDVLRVLLCRARQGALDAAGRFPPPPPHAARRATDALSAMPSSAMPRPPLYDSPRI